MLNDLPFNELESTDLDVTKLVDSTLNIKFSLDPDFANRYGLENIPKPAPMAKFFPEENRRNTKIQASGKPAQINHARSCMPMMDAMKLGFGIPLWTDFYIDEGVIQEMPLMDHDPEAMRATKFFKVDAHENAQIEGMSMDRDKLRHGPVDKITGQRYPILPKLINPWKVQVTDGWSLLLLPPLNNFDLPFQCFSGFVDADRYMATFNLPCWITDKTFTGKIEKGTVIATLIPIPRVQRKTKIQVYDEEDKKNRTRFRYVMETTLKDGYLRYYRDKRR